MILILLSLLKSIYQIYASLAIGQLANKHRVLLALGAYIGLNLVITILSAIVMVAAENLGISQWLNTVISGGADNVFRAGADWRGNSVSPNRGPACGVPCDNGTDSQLKAEPAVKPELYWSGE